VSTPKPEPRCAWCDSEAEQDHPLEAYQPSWLAKDTWWGVEPSQPPLYLHDDPCFSDATDTLLTGAK